MDTYHTKAHFIDDEHGEMVASMYIQHVPRVGEECRFSNNRYYRVNLVVHVYDEDGPAYRVNIGISRI